MIPRVEAAPVHTAAAQNHFDKQALYDESTRNKTKVVALAVIAAIVLAVVSPILKTVIVGGLIIGAALWALSHCADCCCTGSHYPTRDRHYHHHHPVPVPYPVPGQPPVLGPRGPLPPLPGNVPPNGPKYPVGARHGGTPVPRGGLPPPPPGGRYPVGARH